jgi:hypothetical protein
MEAPRHWAAPPLALRTCHAGPPPRGHDIERIAKMLTPIGRPATTPLHRWYQPTQTSCHMDKSCPPETILIPPFAAVGGPVPRPSSLGEVTAYRRRLFLATLLVSLRDELPLQAAHDAPNGDLAHLEGLVPYLLCYLWQPAGVCGPLGPKGNTRPIDPAG